METILSSVSDFIWNPLAYFVLASGVFFTFVTRGVQFRRLPDMIRQLRTGGSADGGMSSFQALALTLSSRVGVGSIAGVATAIAVGGPGALFWLIVTGLVGSTVAYSEAVLAQVFKRRIHGEDRGGMPYYIQHGLKIRWLAVTVAASAMIGYGFVFPGIQANNISSSFQQAFNFSPWVTGLIITTLLGLVVIGGTKRIVQVAQTVVPFMAVGYLLIAAVLLIMNWRDVPGAIGLIITSGMGINQMFGGIIGFAVAWGVRRAVFASATGFGEGTFAAAAADTTHPGKQGIVQAFSIYIDLFLICTATGLMIVVTESYHVVDAAGGFLVDHVPGAIAGPNFVQIAIDVSMEGFGSIFVAIAVFLFAFTSQVFFFYVATTNLVFLLGENRSAFLENVLKIGALTISFVGAVVTADAMWAAGDIGYAVLAWMNIISVLLMTKIVRKVVNDYDRQRKLGQDPVFDPGELGIEGAEWWETTFRQRNDLKAAESAPGDPDSPGKPGSG